jgi:hypothetical protein
MPRPFGSAAAIFALAACSPPPAPDLCGGNGCGSERIIENTFERTVNVATDLLLVVDDTSTASFSGADLATAAEAWAQVLAATPGLSLHVGAVSAAPCLAPPAMRPDCGLPASVAYAVAEDCGSGDNFAGALDGELGCLVDLGTSVCPTTQPIAAVSRMLASTAPGWAGFLRPDAYLAIAILATEDDASDIPIAAFADALRSLKPDPTNQILVSVVGPADASAAPRLFELTQDFGSNGLYHPGGAASLAHALDLLQPHLDTGTFVDGACIAGLRDGDPATPGLQADCAVEETLISTGGTWTTSVLPDCAQAPPPCWRIEPGTAAGYCAGQFLFTVDHGGSDSCPSMPVLTRFECLGCVDPADPACPPPP